MKKLLDHRGVAALVALTLCATTQGREAPDASRKVAFDITAPSLVQALMQFTQQSGLQLMVPNDNTAGIPARRVTGDYTPSAALDQLLAGTQLSYEFANERTISIHLSELPAPTGPRAYVTSDAEKDAGSTARSDVRVAAETSTSRAPTLTTRDAESSGSTQKVDTVVVTGTHFRDVEPVAPVLSFTREDFDEAGASTAQDFLALLPQNFGGAESADTTESAIPGLTFDYGMGSAVNLRGVGGSSTLVLVDGRRVATAGLAAYSDVSMIPLAAVDRMEVMPDGASALYGSDAIGGVVNFVLRKDFSGAETRVRYGDTTEGGLAQRQVSQLFGTTWNTGNALIAYEFNDQDALNRSDRSFSNDPTFSPTDDSAQNGPRNLIPEERRHSVSVFGKQQLSSRITAVVNGLYSKRDGKTLLWDPTNAVNFDEDVARKQYGGSLGLTIDLGGSWQAQIDGNADKSTMYRTDLSSVEKYDYDSSYGLWSTQAQVSGDLVQLPWGAIKLAAGLGYRAESFDLNDYLDGVPRSSLSTDTLTTRSAYTELSIPIGERGDRPRAPLLISLAGRYEDYSTFGNTFDPKVGVRWTPLKSLSLYGTWGTSFKAPSLYQFQESTAINVNNVSNVATSSGPVRSVVRNGNSNDLSEETADTLTLGVEFSAPVGAGLFARLNFFDIDYSDRITRVTANNANVIANPAYQSLVTRRGDIPDAEFNALVTEYLSGADARVLACAGGTINPTTGACSTPPSSVNAILDRRLQNFAAVEVRGLDLYLNQDLELGANRLSFDLNASYFLDFNQQLNPASPSQEILNRLYNPVDMRARGGVSLSRGQWRGALSVNHTAAYSTRDALFRGDGTPMPLTDIASWTTVDMSLSYSTGKSFGSALLDDVGVSLNVQNLLGRNPPYVDDQYVGLGYDPANADPVGRLVSLLFSKSW